MASRRRFLSYLTATSAGALSPWLPAADSPNLITPETKQAVQNGLRWLADQQYANGAFGSVARQQGNPGIAGLAGLAFLSSGSTPGRGPYGGPLRKVIDYLISCATPTGYNHRTNSEAESPMYVTASPRCSWLRPWACLSVTTCRASFAKQSP